MSGKPAPTASTQGRGGSGNRADGRRDPEGADSAALLTLTLRSLRRVDASTAFQPITDLREIDYADLGDMEHDDFARQHTRQGFQAH